MEYHVLDALGELLERRLDCEVVMLGEVRQQLEIERIAPVPAFDGAAREAQVGKCHNAFGVEEIDGAQAVTAWARAHRVVKGKQAWLELGQAVAADWAGELAREHELGT